LFTKLKSGVQGRSGKIEKKALETLMEIMKKIRKY
jgi:hypothetical protein